ncbi:MAG: hypothetical protein Q4F84_06070 [Fibrobacter sp.]|nr:hypothetical protein [Fibrobacter sp.]
MRTRISKSQLLKLQKKYHTDDAIGQLFGISRQAVQYLRKKYGIAPVDNKCEKRNQELIEEYNRGVVGTKLAKKYNLSITQIYRIIHMSKKNPAQC